MERLLKPDRVYALAAATAHDFNNELTVILSSASSLISQLGPEHPARERVLELQDAARRCARKTSGLLQFGLRRASGVTRMPLERLIQED